MAVLDLATIITPMKFNFLHIIFVVSVILNLDANLFYLFISCLYNYIFICVFIYLFIYLLFRYIIFYLFVILYILRFFFDLVIFIYIMSICVCVNRTIDGVLDGSSF